MGFFLREKAKAVRWLAMTSTGANSHRKTGHLFCKSDIQSAEHNVTAQREDSPEGMLLPTPLERNIRQSYTSDVVTRQTVYRPQTPHPFMKHRDTESPFHVTLHLVQIKLRKIMQLSDKKQEKG